jgi:molybdenum ABC transporter molybdate-binding protein
LDRRETFSRRSGTARHSTCFCRRTSPIRGSSKRREQPNAGRSTSTRRDGSCCGRARIRESTWDARVRRIAIANPEHAPYGRAAVAALRHQGLYEKVQAKLVLGENISQAAQFAETGSADAGVIALSLAQSPALRRAGAYFEIPDGWHPPIEQAAIVLAGSHRKTLARQFIEYLKKPGSTATLQSYGFAVPQAVRQQEQ